MSAMSKNMQLHEPTQHETPRVEIPIEYLGHEQSTAKWVANQELSDCPPCGLTLRSTVQLPPSRSWQAEHPRSDVLDARSRADRRSEARSTGAADLTRQTDN